MKILFVGDVHNHSYIFNDIEKLDKEYNLDKIIFLGDYVDDWNTTNHESLQTLDKVIQLKKSNPDKYIFCLGNHEFSYLGYPCSGHQYELEDVMTQKLKENIDCLDFYTVVNIDNKDYYCSHAGFTPNFVKRELGKDFNSVLQDANKNKLKNLYLLTMCSFLRGGNCPYSSFIWADRREHFNDLNKIIPYQIVGHSPVKSISNISYEGGMIYFCDTHSTYQNGEPIGDKSYLMWCDNEIKIIDRSLKIR